MSTQLVKNTYYQGKRSTYGVITNNERNFSLVSGEVILIPNYLSLTRNDDPNFRAKIANRDDAGLPYLRQTCSFGVPTSTCDTVTPAPTFMGQPNPSGRILGRDNNHRTPVWPQVFQNYSDVAIRDMAIKRLRAKLDQRTGQSKLIAPLAESKELHGLIRKATTITADVVKALIHLKKGHVRQVYKEASEIWLTYGFGVAPTLQDIQSVGQSIADYINRSGEKLERFSGSAVRTVFSNVNTPGQTGTWGASITFVSSGTAEIGYRFTAGVDMTVYAGNDYGILSQLGVSPPDLVPALWELTAFSWVADYFGTIGDFLSDTFSSNPGTTVYVSESRRYKVDGKTIGLYIKDPLTVIASQTNPEAPFHYTEFQRYILSSLPVRALRLKTLDEVGINGIGKLLNLAAVLAK